MYEMWMLFGMSMATAIVAGVFLTFSDFVMRSLAAAPPAAGAEAMQQINRKVLVSVFMTLFFGLAIASLWAAYHAFSTMTGSAQIAAMSGALLYLIGVFGVTIFGNVPMNNRLDRMTFGGSEAQAYWPTYVQGWVGLNHVRTAASAAAASSFGIAALLI